MVKQDQNRSPQPDQARKQAQAIPQGSHKEKAPENLKEPAGEGAMQGLKSKENKGKPAQQDQRKPQDFDRNEGEGRSQKS